MSKIGRLPIPLPSGVTAQVTPNAVTITGPKGELKFALPKSIRVTLTDQVLTCVRSSESKDVRALHGTTRSILSGMVIGVSVGFTKTLELVGTGYRAKLQGNKLVLSLGFSHEVEFIPPAGITLSVEGTNLVTIAGFDKQAVGEVAAKIRSYRKPEPYKGKGIRYQHEIVRKKAGKAGKAAASA